MDALIIIVLVFATVVFVTWLYQPKWEPEEEPCCGNCKWRVEGRCWVNPPQIIGNGWPYDSIRPMVAASDICGKHSLRLHGTTEEEAEDMDVCNRWYDPDS